MRKHRREWLDDLSQEWPDKWHIAQSSSLVSGTINDPDPADSQCPVLTFTGQFSPKAAVLGLDVDPNDGCVIDALFTGVRYDGSVDSPGCNVIHGQFSGDFLGVLHGATGITLGRPCDIPPGEKTSPTGGEPSGVGYEFKVEVLSTDTTRNWGGRTITESPADTGNAASPGLVEDTCAAQGQPEVVQLGQSFKLAGATPTVYYDVIGITPGAGTDYLISVRQAAAEGALGNNGKPITLPCHNTFKQELRIDCTCTPPASCPVDPAKPYQVQLHTIEVFSDHVVITRDEVSQTVSK